MELTTLFKRESVAELILKTCTDSPLPFKNNGGAHSVPGCGDLEFGGLENRFQKTCRFQDGEVTTSRKKCSHKNSEKHCFSSIQQLNSTRIR